MAAPKWAISIPWRYRRKWPPPGRTTAWCTSTLSLSSLPVFTLPCPSCAFPKSLKLLKSRNQSVRLREKLGSLPQGLPKTKNLPRPGHPLKRPTRLIAPLKGAQDQDLVASSLHQDFLGQFRHQWPATWNKDIKPMWVSKG